jgi:hypothetical protein
MEEGGPLRGGEGGRVSFSFLGRTLFSFSWKHCTWSIGCPWVAQRKNKAFTHSDAPQCPRTCRAYRNLWSRFVVGLPLLPACGRRPGPPRGRSAPPHPCSPAAVGLGMRKGHPMGTSSRPACIGDWGFPSLLGWCCCCGADRGSWNGLTMVCRLCQNVLLLKTHPGYGARESPW